MKSHSESDCAIPSISFYTLRRKFKRDWRSHEQPDVPLLRTFELFEPLRSFLGTNLEGPKGSKNLEGACILDAR